MVHDERIPVELVSKSASNDHNTRSKDHSVHDGVPQSEIQGWSVRQAQQDAGEKELVAADFIQHEFLVPEKANPETAARLKVASIAISNGTSQSDVAIEALQWVEGRRAKNESYDLTWYATGSMVPSILREFVTKNPDLMAAAQLFLFPGKVDRNLASVSGPDSVNFVKEFNRRFTYAFLGAHAFDLASGDAYFHFAEELELQRACASLNAAQKYLFLSPRKFREIEGHIGYGIDDLLRGSRCVTICTASSPEDATIKKAFDILCRRVFRRETDEAAVEMHDSRRLCLRLAGRGGVASQVLQCEGILASQYEPPRDYRRLVDPSYAAIAGHSSEA